MDSAQTALFVPLQDTDTRKLPSEACSAVLLLRTLPPPRFQEGLVAVARNNKESGSSWDWSAVGAARNSCCLLVADQSAQFLERIPSSLQWQKAQVEEALAARKSRGKLYALILMEWQPFSEATPIRLHQVNQRGLYGTCSITLPSTASKMEKSAGKRKRIRSKTPVTVSSFSSAGDARKAELPRAPCALPCIVEVVALWLRFAFESPARKCCSRQRCQRKTRLAQATMSPQQRHALRHICFSCGAAYAQYWAVFFFCEASSSPPAPPRAPEAVQREDERLARKSA